MIHPRVRSQYKSACFALLEARYAYYVLGEILMLDSEYDALEREVANLEDTIPGLRHPDSPIGNVGSDSQDSYPAWMHERVLSLLNTRRIG